MAMFDSVEELIADQTVQKAVVEASERDGFSVLNWQWKMAAVIEAYARQTTNVYAKAFQSGDYDEFQAFGRTLVSLKEHDYEFAVAKGWVEHTYRLKN